jgi:outer membrane lipoprotein-sorting protein
MKLELIALFLTAVAQDNDAEKLFKSMSAKIDKAKTLEIAFEAVIGKGGKEGEIKGSVLIAEGGKLRFDARAMFDQKADRMILISDGTTLRAINRDGAPRDNPVPKNFMPAILKSVKNVGVLTGFLITREGRADARDIKLDDLFKTSDFKLGAKEKIGDKATQSLEYKVSFHADGKDITSTVILWLDAKTHVPARHVLKAKIQGEGEIIITQNYTTFRLDGKLDAKQFELPK